MRSRGGGEALAFPTDVSVVEQLQRLVESAVDHYGRFDVLFNNAGFGRLDWLENLDLQAGYRRPDWREPDRLIQLTGLVLPHMIARRSGVIINMSLWLVGLARPPTAFTPPANLGCAALPKPCAVKLECLG